MDEGGNDAAEIGAQRQELRRKAQVISSFVFADVSFLSAMPSVWQVEELDSPGNRRSSAHKMQNHRRRSADTMATTQTTEQCAMQVSLRYVNDLYHTVPTVLFSVRYSAQIRYGSYDTNNGIRPLIHSTYSNIIRALFNSTVTLETYRQRD